MPRHITVKLLKTKHKENILKVEREKHYLIYIGKYFIQMAADLVRSHESQRNWYIFLQVLKDLSTQNSIYPVKISFKNEKEINTFSDEGKVREFVVNKSILK